MLEPLGEGEAPIPPAIEPARRLMLLARLVQLHLGADAAEALRLAGDLARTLDQLLIEEVDSGPPAATSPRNFRTSPRIGRRRSTNCG